MARACVSFFFGFFFEVLCVSFPCSCCLHARRIVIFFVVKQISVSVVIPSIIQFTEIDLHFIVIIGRVFVCCGACNKFSLGLDTVIGLEKDLVTAPSPVMT